MGLTFASPGSLAFSLLFGRQPATVSEVAGPIIGLGTDPGFSESSRCGAPRAPDPPLQLPTCPTTDTRLEPSDSHAAARTPRPMRQVSWDHLEVCSGSPSEWRLHV